jgi:hypothetical protein
MHDDEAIDPSLVHAAPARALPDLDALEQALQARVAI